jgi:hypothetical protein
MLLLVRRISLRILRKTSARGRKNHDLEKGIAISDRPSRYCGSSLPTQGSAHSILGHAKTPMNIALFARSLLLRPSTMARTNCDFGHIASRFVPPASRVQMRCNIQQIWVVFCSHGTSVRCHFRVLCCGTSTVLKRRVLARVQAPKPAFAPSFISR